MLIDRTGSIASILADAQGGLDSYIDDQAEQPGDCNLTLYAFDSQSFDLAIPRQPIADASRYVIEPRGSTPLYDSVAKTIINTDAVVPVGAHVIVVISTDGYENASHEYNATQVRELIAARETRGWTFTFIGAGIDAFKDGGAMGVPRGATINSTNISWGFDSASSATTRARATGDSINYTDDERKHAATSSPASDQT